MMPRLFMLAAAVAASLVVGASAQSKTTDRWTRSFGVEKDEWLPSGRNPYFILESGYQSTLRNGNEQLVVTVLDDTKALAGVTTRVVEERETKNGQPVEVSRNYFAISRRTNGVFYFGEEVDTYHDGKVSGHEGAWLANGRDVNFGLMMPGDVLLSARYYQEMAPKVAMDRAEIVSTTETVTTPAGTFSGCVKIEETTPLEPGVREYKYYARGIGLVRDGSLSLVKYGMVEKPGAGQR
jgi:hypothetical protein